MLHKYSKIIYLIVTAAFIFSPATSYALPEGGVVVGGDPVAELSNPDLVTLQVDQHLDRAIIDYTSFSIDPGELVNFTQPAPTSIALNRVGGSAPMSQIYGTLSANGRIFLVNPNGITFHNGSIVDTAGLVASTLNMATSDTDFMNPATLTFDFAGDSGYISNQGNIMLNGPGGYVALLGTSVNNTGLITAALGTIALAAGEAMTVSLDPAGLVSVAVTTETSNPESIIAAIENSGTLFADGGKVLLTADVLENVFESAVNTSGIIEATEMFSEQGEVRITATGGADNQGGDVLIGTINTDTVYVSTDSDILDDGNDTTRIYADTIDLNAVGDIGAFTYSPLNLDYLLDVELGTGPLNASAGGSIFIAEHDKADLMTSNYSLASSGTGNDLGLVNMTAGGNITVDTALSGGNNAVWLGSDGDITVNAPFTTSGDLAGIHANGSVFINDDIISPDDIEIEADMDGNGTGLITRSAGSILAQELELHSGQGIDLSYVSGETVTLGSIQAENTTSGNIVIVSEGNLVLADLDSLGFSIKNNAPGGSITITAYNPSTTTPNTMNITEDILTNGGDLTLYCCDDITQAVNTSLLTSGGNVYIYANMMNSGIPEFGIFVQGDGADINAGLGNIDIYTGDGMTISSLSGSTVILNESSDYIIDGGDSLTDIIADTLIISSVDGIGSQEGITENALETEVNILQAYNSYSGNINIENTGNLYVDSAVNEAEGGEVNITVNSDVTVDTIIAGNVAVTANNGSIFDDEDPATYIEADDITLSAENGNIGALGGPSSDFDVLTAPFLDVKLGSGNLSAYAQPEGEIFIAERIPGVFTFDAAALSKYYYYFGTGDGASIGLANLSGGMDIDTVLDLSANLWLGGKGPVNVNYDIITDDGFITLYAEGGDFIQAAGTSIDATGEVEIWGINNILADIHSQDKIQVWGEGNLTVLENSFIFAQSGDPEINFYTDDIDLLPGSELLAGTMNGSAQVYLEANDGNIDITDSSVTAWVDGNGTSLVYLQTYEQEEGDPGSGNINIIASEITAMTEYTGNSEVKMVCGPEGMGYGYGSYFEDYFDPAGDINIYQGSDVLAKTGASLFDDSSIVKLSAEDIFIGDPGFSYSGIPNTVTAEVSGTGNALIEMTAGKYRKYFTQDVWSGDTGLGYGYEDFDGGGIYVLDSSDVLAQVGSSGEGFGSAEVEMNARFINLYGDVYGESPDPSATVKAIVADSGHAEVDMWASDYYAFGEAWDWDSKEGIDWIENYGYSSDNDRFAGSINIIDSEVLAKTGSSMTTAEINMTTGNITLDNSSVIAEVENSGLASIYMQALIDHEYIYGEGESGDNFYFWTNTNQEGGHIDIFNGSDVLAFVGTSEGGGSGTAEVEMDAGYINIGCGGYEEDINDSSSVQALVSDSGYSCVNLTGVWYRSESRQDYYSDPDYENLVFYIPGDQFYGGEINLRNNSFILAETGYRTTSPGDSDLFIYSGDLNVGDPESDEDSSAIVSIVNGNGDARVTIDNTNWSRSYTYDSGDTLTSKTEDYRDQSDWEAGINLYQNSTILAETDSGEAGIDMTGSCLFMDNSEIWAEVEDQGDAYVTMDAIDHIRETTYSYEFSGGNICITDNSLILADVGGYGGAYILLNSLMDIEEISGLDDLPDIFESMVSEDIRGGQVCISDSIVHAEADEGLDTALIGILSQDIVLENSEVSALMEGEGIAAIGLVTLNDIDIDEDSSVSAASGSECPEGPEEAVSAVLALAGDDINAWGEVSAVSTGASAVALLALEDIYAVDVLAEGSSELDVLELIEGWLSDPDSFFDIGEQYDYSSGILLASLAEDIYLGDVTGDIVLVMALGHDELLWDMFDEDPGDNDGDDEYCGTGSIYDLGEPEEEEPEEEIGTVTAHYLGMMARNDIGTCEDEEVEYAGPIRTDVDILSAYSFDQGDIYIKEANDIELGLYLPFIVNETGIEIVEETVEVEGKTEVVEKEVEVVVPKQLGALGLSVAANDGTVNIVSEGDMLVNSVLSPRGGVYLKSEEGSIYAGRGWNPVIDFEEESEPRISQMPYGLEGIIEHVIDGFLMDELEGIEDGPDGFAAAMAAFPCITDSCDLEQGPNVMAGSYSYFSAPEGTIGVGDIRDEQAGPDAYNPLWVCIQALSEEKPALPEGFVPLAGLTLDIGGVVPSAYSDTLGNGNIGISGAIKGIVRPGVEAITGVYPSPDLTNSTENPLDPQGYVFYDDFADDSTQPIGLFESISAENEEPAENYLEVNQIWPGPRAGFAQYNVPPKNYRVYYELTNRYRVVASDPAQPTEFYAYHPLTPTDTAAFDDIALDAEAYNFIADRINTRRPLAPYFGEEEEEKKRRP